MNLRPTNMIAPGDCPARSAGKRGGPLTISHLTHSQAHQHSHTRQETS